jgi:alkaline phosphatase
MKLLLKFLFLIVLFTGILLTISTSCTEKEKEIRNIILMIGDGMGVSQIYAGMTANKGDLNIAGIKHIGFHKTNSYDNYTTDSAAGGTAISSGLKTRNGMIGMGPDSVELRSILEIAEDHGLFTGLVSTSSITHATPASFLAHQVNRGMYEEIARDFIDTELEVIIGGGRKHFVDRKDGRNLLNEFRSKGYKVFTGLTEATECELPKMIVLTADVHNPPYTEGRGDMLPNATSKAIQILKKNPEGFFLMVEGSQIDWGGHDNDIDYITNEVIDFDNAVKKALDFAASDEETLVIVTADHECGGLGLNNGDFETGHIDAGFTTVGHTGVMVPVFAYGPGSEEFTGIYDNTDLFKKLMTAYGFNDE